MNTAIIISIISALFAAIAAIISVIALWQTHFAPFRVLTASGDLSFSIYPIKSEDQGWFIPSFLVPILLTNTGARPGQVEGLRIKVSYPDLPIPDNQELFEPNFEIHPQRVGEIDRERFSWIETATIGRWMPFIILPKQTVTKVLIFETRWDEPVIQNNIHAALEIYTGAIQKWNPIANWDLVLSAEVWTALVNAETPLLFPERNARDAHSHSLVPPDLHKYTRMKDPLPQGKIELPRSYLGFPQAKDREGSETQR